MTATIAAAVRTKMNAPATPHIARQKLISSVRAKLIRKATKQSDGMARGVVARLRRAVGTRMSNAEKKLREHGPIDEA